MNSSNPDDAGGREKLRVLVVEDETDDARFALDAVESEEREVQVEATPYGERALELVEDWSLDCVLLDYRLPRMDGAEFLEKLRERGEEVPVVVFTGRGSAEIEEELIEAGADAYLSKDESDDREIRATIRSAVED